MVRVRFAPSPTGFLHLGGLRTALFNYLFASVNGGSVILRIEDTDQDRVVPGSVEALQAALNWAGIIFNEGPHVGGPHVPYIQSQRLHIYRQYAMDLVKGGSAYHCFCSKERLALLRAQKAVGGYDGHCRTLSQRKVEDKLGMGLPSVIRLKVPTDTVVTVDDEVYGKVSFHCKDIDDQVLLKANGFPTYHLACVVDDHVMEISHVLRGEEWLPSTAKHVLLYKSYNWPLPTFAHLPLLKTSSGAKLSKRQKDTFVEHYKEQGFLPAALINFVVMLGWHPRTRQEIFTLQEMIDNFRLSDINKSGAIVNEDNLKWINIQHFNKQTQVEENMEVFVQQLRLCLLKNGVTCKDPTLSYNYLKSVILLLEERASLVNTVPDEAPYFWFRPSYTDKAISQISNNERMLRAILKKVKGCPFSEQALNLMISEVADFFNVSKGMVMSVCRAVVTGNKPGPGIVPVMVLLGKEEVECRLLQALGTV